MPTLPAVAGASRIAELIETGALDLEDEILSGPTSGWCPIWTRLDVQRPPAWALLVRLRKAEMQDRMALVRGGDWNRAQYLEWRSRELQLIATSGIPTERVDQRQSGTPMPNPAAAFAQTEAQSHRGETGWRKDAVPNHLWESYEFDRQIGFGGTGEVVLVRHRFTGAVCAVKIMRPDLPESVVKNEIGALHGVRSKHVVTLRFCEPAATPSGQRWMIFYEYVPGQTLHEFRLSQPSRRIEDAKLVARILVGIARGLADMHLGKVVHRDLKPANIILRSNETTDDIEPVIIDLGMARGGSMPGVTILGGTPGYQSPEQEAGERCCPRTDVFAFGLVAYEVITGRRLAGGKLVRLHDVCPGLPPKLDDFVKARCANWQLEERVADGRELLQQLVQIFRPRGQSNTAAVPRSSPSPPEERSAPQPRQEPPAAPRPQSEPETSRASSTAQVLEAIEAAKLAAGHGKIDNARAVLQAVQSVDPLRVLRVTLELTEAEIQSVRRQTGGTSSSREENYLLRVLEQLVPLEPSTYLPRFLDQLGQKMGEQSARRGIEAIRAVFGSLDARTRGHSLAFLHATLGTLAVPNLSLDAEKDLAWSASTIVERVGSEATSSMRRDAIIQLAKCMAEGRGTKMDVARAVEWFQSGDANDQGHGLAALAEFLRKNPHAPVPGITRAEAAIRAWKRGCPQGAREHGLVLLERSASNRGEAVPEEAVAALASALQGGDAAAREALRSHIQAGKPLVLSSENREVLRTHMPELAGFLGMSAAMPSQGGAKSSGAPAAERKAANGGSSEWEQARRQSDALSSTNSADSYQAGLGRLVELSRRGNACARLFLLLEAVHLFNERRPPFGPARRGQSARVLEEAVEGRSSAQIESLTKSSLGRAVAREVERLAMESPQGAAPEVRSFIEFLMGACLLGSLANTASSSRDGRAILRHFTRSWEIQRSHYNSRALWHCFDRGIGTTAGFSTPLAKEVDRYVRNNG